MGCLAQTSRKYFLMKKIGIKTKAKAMNMKLSPVDVAPADAEQQEPALPLVLTPQSEVGK